MSDATQLTQIADNVNHGYIAGRDLYLGDQYVVQETLYFEPDLTDVEPPSWTTTPKARELTDVLASRRLILLAGRDLDDKTIVARHMAWLLRQDLEPSEVLVREWYRSSDPQKIETAFHATATTVLLLPEVQPHHIGHRLNELVRLLQTRGNYIVITTEGTREEWGIGSGSPEESLWYEISWETYYGRSFLAELLLNELAGSYLPAGLPQDHLQTGSLLAEGLTVEQAAVRLRQPDRIRRFAEWLLAQAAVSPGDLLAQLDQLSGNRAAIFQWFRRLDHTDQLLALALVLFDGLPDDQAFAGVEYLVSEAWRRTDPNLPHFDYQALGRLSAYFHLSEAGQDGARIETSSRQQRETILQAAWELQRRRLLSVVPALTRLARQLSANGATPAPAGTQEQSSPTWKSRLFQVGLAPGKALGVRSVLKHAKTLLETPDHPDGWRFTQGAARELASSPRRVEQLQRSVVESLSQIGLLSFEAVEAAFLELAADESAGMQTVVAKALAAWRGEGHDEKVFRVLQDWWAAGSRTTPPKALAKRKDGGNPLAAIRATVALAVGYALQHDPPNELAPELAGLLRAALTDSHPIVRQRVLELTLPLAAASHPGQLETLLRQRLADDQEQMYAITFGIAMAYSLRPLESLRIIDQWHLMVRAQEARQPEDRTITPRDRLLTAVALFYGYVRCEQNQDVLTADEAISQLRSILTTERHPFVRTHALMAMGLQAVHNFELAASMLIDLIAEIALPDRSNVVSIFTRAYLIQRGQLSGGDGEIEAGGRTYPIWTHAPRPLTAIEGSLYDWLRDTRHPVARQVAVQAFAAFAATELERKEREVVPHQAKATAPVRRRITGPVARKPRRLRRLSPLAHLAVFFSAPLQRPTRKLLRPVLAEVIEVERSDRRQDPKTSGAAAGTSALTVIAKWRESGDENMQSLARSLGVALRLFRWRWILLLAAVLGGVLWRDWRDWRWSHADPLPVAETLQLQHQKMLPLRLVWQQWVPKFRQYEADRRAAIEKAFLEKARKTGTRDLSEAFQNIPGPGGRTRNVAERTLLQIAAAQKIRDDEELIDEYREARAQAYQAEAAQGKKDPSKLSAADLLAFLRELRSTGPREFKPTQAETDAERVVLIKRRIAPPLSMEQQSLLLQKTLSGMPRQEEPSELPFSLPHGFGSLPFGGLGGRKPIPTSALGRPGEKHGKG